MEYPAIKTEGEAQVIVDGKNENITDYLRFCPLIKDRCNPGCICFEKAKFTTRENSRWDPDRQKYDTVFIVYDPYCGNAMFTEKEIYYNS